MKVFFRGMEVQKGREWTPEELARWVATHSSDGEPILVINDGPGDDANVEEVWVGSMPPEGEDARAAFVQEEVRKKKGGRA
jgi:hypothetical protein